MDPDPDPDLDQQRAEDSARIMLAADAASAMLGIEVVHVRPGEAVARMTVRADMLNGWGTCHGALVAAVADTAFAVACNSYGTVTVAAGFDVTLLEPAREGDRLVATARRRSASGRTGVYDVTIARLDDALGSVVIGEFRGRSRSLGRPVTDSARA